MSAIPIGEKLYIQKPQDLFRMVKRIRNLAKETPPRNQELIFESYSLSFPQASFTFRHKKNRYVSNIQFSKDQGLHLADKDWGLLLTTIGLTLIPVHFRLADFSRVRIECSKLNQNVIPFLEDYIKHSLGEFRYLVGLDPTRPIEVIADHETSPHGIDAYVPEEKALLLNGGGKDSVVAAELTKKMNIPFTWLTAGPSKAKIAVIQASGVSSAFSVEYGFSQDIKKNAVYEYGTVPLASIVSAIALVFAFAHNYKYIFIGNEQSADEGNILYKGMNINHQYTKSLRFEKSFDQYIRQNINEELSYTSLLRPLNELHIAKLFSQNSEYFTHIVSCNKKQHQLSGGWCKDCSKCAFTFLALYPFLDEEDITAIFGEDLFYNQKIRKHILQLTKANIKPWDCVGTREECKVALDLSLQKLPSMEFSRWPYRKNLEESLADIQSNSKHNKQVNYYSESHNLPANIEEQLKKVLQL